MEERSELNFEWKKGHKLKPRPFAVNTNMNRTNVICRSRILIKLTGKRLRD